MINWYRIAIVTGIVIVLVSYVRHDFGFPLITILPFLSDEPCLPYDLAGLIMFAIVAGAVKKWRETDRAERE
jgi:hypothetical protein